MTDYVVPTYFCCSFYLFQLKSIHKIVSEREWNYERKEQKWIQCRNDNKWVFVITSNQNDCETVYSLAKSLQQDGVTGFGIIPYFTLTAATILEMLSSNEIKLEIPYSARIKDIRIKLKIFEDGYSKSKRMLLAIDDMLPLWQTDEIIKLSL